MFTKILLLLIAYVIGSIPFSIIIGKIFQNKDVRDYGSGNPGTTNAIRVLGKKLGLLVFALDVLKAAIFIILMRYTPLFENIEHFSPIYYGVAACFGHSFPIFLKFKGGKAAACGAGMICAMNFWVFAIGMAGFFLIIKITKYVSVGSCGAALVMAMGGLLCYLFGISDYTIHFPIGGFLVTLLIIYRHKSNFIRIKNGVENKSKLFVKKG